MEHWMNEWVRQRIAVLHERFSNASHLVRQRIPVLRARFSGTLRWVREQIPVLREHFHNVRRIDQIFLITLVLSILSLPIYFFVPISRLGEVTTGIFFGILIVDFLWRERYPALKRWIAETEHGQNNGKDPLYEFRVHNVHRSTILPP
jgi:glutathione S-transferase